MNVSERVCMHFRLREGNVTEKGNVTYLGGHPEIFFVVENLSNIKGHDKVDVILGKKWFKASQSSRASFSTAPSEVRDPPTSSWKASKSMTPKLGGVLEKTTSKYLVINICCGATLIVGCFQ
jgi:hypothetical protein